MLSFSHWAPSNSGCIKSFLFALTIATPTAFAQTPTASAGAALSPRVEAFFDSAVFYGDFRYRLEGDRKRPDEPNRWRSRLRLRLGANHSVRNDLLVGARLTTGPKDGARDSNASNGGEFSKLELNLDRLFLTWTPDEAKECFATLGKFAHTFQRNPVYEELVWYSDVQPEGVLFGKESHELGPLDRLRLQGGYYIYSERAEDDIRIAVAEIMTEKRLSTSTRGNLSAAWYGYENASLSPSATSNHYQIIDTIAALMTEFDEVPWRFSAEGISNLSATGSSANGWALGLSRGATRLQGDWRAYYQYQEIGNDAVFAPVANGDFLLDHNFRGHVANFDYVLARDVTFRTRFLSAEPLDSSLAGGNSDTTYRLRLELIVKF
ncbi:MAG: hypothetical protein ACI9F9_000492 [Candidatus Paceibacteria bacterium]|jgi:hypothetical protein